MKASLAIQAMSARVGRALRELDAGIVNSGLDSCLLATAHYVERFNEYFDMMNTRFMLSLAAQLLDECLQHNFSTNACTTIPRNNWRTIVGQPAGDRV
jgi:hypothetical protein